MFQQPLEPKGPLGCPVRMPDAEDARQFVTRQVRHGWSSHQVTCPLEGEAVRLWTCARAQACLVALNAQDAK